MAKFNRTYNANGNITTNKRGSAIRKMISFLEGGEHTNFASAYNKYVTSVGEKAVSYARFYSLVKHFDRLMVYADTTGEDFIYMVDECNEEALYRNINIILNSLDTDDANSVADAIAIIEAMANIWGYDADKTKKTQNYASLIARMEKFFPNRISIMII